MKEQLDFKPHLQQSINEIKQNSRLRLGLWIIVFITLFYIFLFISDERASEERQLVDNLVKIQTLENVQSDTQWAERLEREKQLNNQLIKYFWQATTVGLAQAKVQSEVEALAENAKLQSLRIRLGAAQLVPESNNLWRVQVELSARFDAEAVEQLLIDLEQFKYAINVDNISIAEKRGRRITVRLSAFFKGIEANGNS